MNNQENWEHFVLFVKEEGSQWAVEVSMETLGAEGSTKNILGFPNARIVLSITCCNGGWSCILDDRALGSTTTGGKAQ